MTWVKDKRTGKLKQMSPAVARHKINLQPNKYAERHEKMCSCGAGNMRERTTCRSCGKEL